MLLKTFIILPAIFCLVMAARINSINRPSEFRDGHFSLDSFGHGKHHSHALKTIRASVDSSNKAGGRSFAENGLDTAGLGAPAYGSVGGAGFGSPVQNFNGPLGPNNLGAAGGSGFGVNNGGQSGSFGGQQSTFGGQSAFTGPSTSVGGQSTAFGAQSAAFGVQAGSFGGQSGSFGGQPGPFGGQSGSIGGQSGSLGGQPGPFGSQPGSFGIQAGPVAGQPGSFGGHSSSFGGPSGLSSGQAGSYGGAQGVAPEYNGGAQSVYGGNSDAGMPYQFQYNVNEYGNNFGHSQSSDGKQVSGRYFVQLPDGRLQTVDFKADPLNGYTADVQYQGQAQYPSNQGSYSTGLGNGGGIGGGSVGQLPLAFNDQGNYGSALPGSSASYSDSGAFSAKPY